MNEMIKSVALAIWDKGAICDWCPDVMSPNCCCYDIARAVIETMRVPNEVMIEAGVSELSCYTGIFWEEAAISVFRAMIDAALGNDSSVSNPAPGTSAVEEGEYFPTNLVSDNR